MKINTYRNHSRLLRLVRYTLPPVPTRFNGSGSINRGSIEADTLQRLYYTSHRMLRFLPCNNTVRLNLLLYVVTKYENCYFDSLAFLYQFSSLINIWIIFTRVINNGILFKFPIKSWLATRDSPLNRIETRKKFAFINHGENRWQSFDKLSTDPAKNGG